MPPATPFKEISLPISDALELAQFREMDYFAVAQYALPIELMMENAGAHLASLVANHLPVGSAKVLIGVGNGNNGGGGLVAARRLAAWGYEVYLDVYKSIDRELPLRQFNRALQFGASPTSIEAPDVWVDAYLGFSQRLPLDEQLSTRLQRANDTDCHRISLDIPTGFLGDSSQLHFQAHQVLSLAAGKRILYHLPESTELYLADLGIPRPVYEKFGIQMPSFAANGILKIHRI